MKKSTLICLGVLFIVSVGGNIYQYVENSDIHNELNSLTSAKNELQLEVDNRTEGQNDLTSEIESLNMTISEMTEKVDSLTSNNELLQNEIVVLQEEIDKRQKSSEGVTASKKNSTIDNSSDSQNNSDVGEWVQSVVEGSDDDRVDDNMGAGTSTGTPGTPDYSGAGIDPFK